MCFGPYCTVYILCISSQRADGRQAWLRAEEEKQEVDRDVKDRIEGLHGEEKKGGSCFSSHAMGSCVYPLT